MNEKIIVVRYESGDGPRWAFESEEIALDELRNRWVREAEACGEKIDTFLEAGSLDELCRAQVAAAGSSDYVEWREVDALGLLDGASLDGAELLSLADWLTDGGVLHSHSDRLSWWSDTASYAEHYPARDARADTEAALYSIGAPHAAIDAALQGWV